MLLTVEMVLEYLTQVHVVHVKGVKSTNNSAIQ